MANQLRAKRRKLPGVKRLHIPVMRETQKAFMFDAHGALAGLRLTPSIDTLKPRTQTTSDNQQAGRNV